MNFKKWVKSIQTAGYNGARKVFATFYTQLFFTEEESFELFTLNNSFVLFPTVRLTC
jgi:hypothetical protein